VNSRRFFTLGAWALIAGGRDSRTAYPPTAAAAAYLLRAASSLRCSTGRTSTRPLLVPRAPASVPADGRLATARMRIGHLGHLALVDAATLWLRTRVSSWSPSSIVVSGLEHTTLDFGPLGSANAFRAFAGFSFWVALSLVFLGVFLHLVRAQPSVWLKPFIVLSLVLSSCFFVLAAVCFIWPAGAGGLAAVALFSLSLWRRES